MDIAKKLGAADEYLELDRSNPGSQWEQLKKDNPYGFDAVVSGFLSSSKHGLDSILS